MVTQLLGRPPRRPQHRRVASVLTLPTQELVPTNNVAAVRPRASTENDEPMMMMRQQLHLSVPEMIATTTRPSIMPSDDDDDDDDDSHEQTRPAIALLQPSNGTSEPNSTPIDNGDQADDKPLGRFRWLRRRRKRRQQEVAAATVDHIETLHPTTTAQDSTHDAESSLSSSSSFSQVKMLVARSISENPRDDTDLMLSIDDIDHDENEDLNNSHHHSHQYDNDSNGDKSSTNDNNQATTIEYEFGGCMTIVPLE